MAKSTQPAPAADTTPIDEQPAEDQSVLDQMEAEPASVVSFWAYIGHEQRIYSSVPVTVAEGDVIAWVGPPARDGRWTEHPGPATREPDNTPKPAPADDAEPATVEE